MESWHGYRRLVRGHARHMGLVRDRLSVGHLDGDTDDSAYRFRPCRRKAL